MLELVGVPYEEGFNLKPKSYPVGDRSQIEIPGSNKKFRLYMEGKLAVVNTVQFPEDKTTVAENGGYRLTRMGGYDWWLFNKPDTPEARKRRFVDEATFTTFA